MKINVQSVQQDTACPITPGPFGDKTECSSSPGDMTDTDIGNDFLRLSVILNTYK